MIVQFLCFIEVFIHVITASGKSLLTIIFPIIYKRPNALIVESSSGRLRLATFPEHLFSQHHT